MSSGPNSGLTSGGQMEFENYSSEEKAIENEILVAEQLSTISSNTNSTDIDNSVDLPKNNDQLNHIFGERPGHLSDTAQNRKLLTNLANDKNSFLGKDMYGNSWNAKTQPDGSQLWVRHQNSVINEGGLNLEPRHWDNITGLNDNPVRRRKKRK